MCFPYNSTYIINFIDASTTPVTRLLIILFVVQQIFQAVLATDGRTSFVIFIYEDGDAITSIASGGRGVVGFDAGDQLRGATIQSSERNTPLQNFTIFRVDGNWLM